MPPKNLSPETSQPQPGTSKASGFEIGETYRVSSEHGIDDLLERIELVAELWHGEWQPEEEANSPTRGRLGLPVTAGLKRGWVAGELEIEPAGSGSELSFKVDSGEMKTDKASVSILMVGAAGGLVSVFAPFVPSLFALVPVGLVLGFSAWFMIVTRLKNAGPAEFFDQIEGS